jgi:hypothetical protein
MQTHFSNKDLYRIMPNFGSPLSFFYDKLPLRCVMKYLLFLAIFLPISFSEAANEPILIIGDSLSCGSFGRNLVENLSNAGNQVTLYCAVSSTPSHWLKGKNPKGQDCKIMTTGNPKSQLCGGNGRIPSLKSILKQHAGARVIVALGTNSMLAPKADASYSQMAKAIKDNGNNCDWIGPPHMNSSQSKGFPKGRIAKLEHNLGGFYESLATATESRCNLIDSRKATEGGTIGDQTVDGVHRNEAAGKYWATEMLSNFVSTVDPEHIKENREVSQ